MHCKIARLSNIIDRKNRNWGKANIPLNHLMRISQSGLVFDHGSPYSYQCQYVTDTEFFVIKKARPWRQVHLHIHFFLHCYLRFAAWLKNDRLDWLILLRRRLSPRLFAYLLLFSMGLFWHIRRLRGWFDKRKWSRCESLNSLYCLRHYYFLCQFPCKYFFWGGKINLHHVWS